MGVVFRCDWCQREVECAINPQHGRAWEYRA